MTENSNELSQHLKEATRTNSDALLRINARLVRVEVFVSDLIKASTGPEAVSKYLAEARDRGMQAVAAAAAAEADGESSDKGGEETKLPEGEESPDGSDDSEDDGDETEEDSD